MIAKIINAAKLFYKEGSSDKVYNVQVVEEGSWRVDYQYGRRGDSLQSGTKINGVDLCTAQKVFYKLIKDKLAKGYSSGDIGSITDKQIVTPPVKSDLFVPHLLKPVSEIDVAMLLKDDQYCIQEKMDGKHLTICQGDSGIIVRNKIGKSIGIPASIPTIPAGSMIDVEAIGDKYYAFDIMMYGNIVLNKMSYVERLDSLVELCGDYPDVLLVPFVIGKKKKQAFFNKLIKDGKEGVVFKKLGAIYQPGFRNMDMLKFKFCSELSARVCKGREGKRSVGLELLYHDMWINVGNVTIPVNHEIPPVGSVCEVKYLYGMPGGSLIQPQYRGVRDDVDENECTVEQIKMKAES